jgi:hypothetical protein
MSYSVLTAAKRHTAADYWRAIADLQDAMTQLAPDGNPCAVCGDSGHMAWECHHNPLAVMHEYRADRLRWRCFHCDAVFTDEATAREHFGEGHR